MKRSPELTPLSHDHHQALFVAMQLKRAEDRSVGATYLDFFDATGNRHFTIEEAVLLPGWIAADPNADTVMANRVLVEHLDLRSRAGRLRSDLHTIEDLHELGELLDRHVRFEERELFPRIESGLDTEAIAALGAEIEVAEGVDG
jgi:hemerythrin-like domain-containing protein